MKGSVLSAQRPILWSAVVGLLLLTTWLYLPSLGFGFWWDDPLWFGRVVGQPVAALLRPMADFQFYRPGTMLYNRLFMRADGTFVPALMHAAQLGWHVLNVALVYALARRLRLGAGTAVVAAGLFALYPLSHQAVAWAAPQQPLALALQNGAWLAYLAVRSRRRHRAERAIWPLAGFSLLLFLLALSVQESTVVMAAVPLLLEGVPGRASQRTVRRYRPFWLAFAYPALAAVFALLWWQVPRQAGYTTFSPERPVLLYFLQGFIFPWVGRPSGYEPGYTPGTGLLLLLAGVTVGVLLGLAGSAGRGRQALFGLIWAVLGLLLGLVGLSYSYVSLASRLFYYAAPGIALLWASALWPPAHRSPAWRLAGLAVLLLIGIQSGWLLLNFQALYGVGTTHLAELTAVTAEAGAERQLFVNFPDRYAPKRPPYPLGYWGMTLAPVVTDLGSFPALLTGRRPETASYSLPWIDGGAREMGPYHVDLRGVITPVGTLYELAGQAEAVYLSRYTPDGRFALWWAGKREPAVENRVGKCETAVWDEKICLQAMTVRQGPDSLTLHLTWLSLAPAGPHDTIFVHLGQPGQPPIAQADGDAWLGMLPLATWQPGDIIREQRIISLPATAADGDVLRLGVYNRVTGERLPGRTAAGALLPDNALTADWR